jgi:hypothetical protein
MGHGIMYTGSTEQDGWPCVALCEYRPYKPNWRWQAFRSLSQDQCTPVSDESVQCLDNGWDPSFYGTECNEMRHEPQDD